MKRKRNKEETIAKLIKAVGTLLAENGHAGLGVNKVAAAAGVSKPMIYEYFGNFSGLLKVYTYQRDYWLPYFESLKLSESLTDEELKNLFIKILQDQFRYFSHENEMQKLILWQISEYNPLMRTVSETREAAGVKLLEMTDGHFKNSGISLKAVIALLVGGIYYNVLHNAAGTGSVSGVDLSSEKDYELMISTVAQIVNWAFHAAETNKID